MSGQGKDEGKSPDSGCAVPRDRPGQGRKSSNYGAGVGASSLPTASADAHLFVRSCGSTAVGLPGFTGRGSRVSFGGGGIGSPSAVLANLSPSCCHTRRVVHRSLLECLPPQPGSCFLLLSPPPSRAFSCKVPAPAWNFLLCQPLLAFP